MITIKEICRDVLRAMNGDIKECSVQLDIPKAAVKIIAESHCSFENLTGRVLESNKPDPMPVSILVPEKDLIREVPVIPMPDPVAPPPPVQSQIPEMSEQMLVEYKDGILNASFCPAEWGRKQKAWEGRDVCLCLPTYKTVPEEFFFNMLALAMRYRQAIRVEHRGGDSMITRSRNQLAKRFLNTGATWAIWFDSDMVFPLGNAGVYSTMTGMRHLAEKFLSVDTIERLITRGKKLVGGCYWDRRGSGRLVACSNTPITAPIPSDNLCGVDFIGTGCWAVHKDVFTDIAKKFPGQRNRVLHQHPDSQPDDGRG